METSNENWVAKLFDFDRSGELGCSKKYFLGIHYAKYFCFKESNRQIDGFFFEKKNWSPKTQSFLRIRALNNNFLHQRFQFTFFKFTRCQCRWQIFHLKYRKNKSFNSNSFSAQKKLSLHRVFPSPSPLTMIQSRFHPFDKRSPEKLTSKLGFDDYFIKVNGTQWCINTTVRLCLFPNVINWANMRDEKIFCVCCICSRCSSPSCVSLLCFNRSQSCE